MKKLCYAFIMISTGFFCSYGCEKLARIPEVQLYSSSGDVVIVKVEIARKPAERNLGLMYRKSLAREKGMLFIFPQEKNHTFIMKNTYIPLDIIFIGSAGHVVGLIENLKPLSKEKYSVEKPSKYVLETNAFFCRDHSIRVGSKVSFKHISE